MRHLAVLVLLAVVLLMGGCKSGGKNPAPYPYR